MNNPISITPIRVNESFNYLEYLGNIINYLKKSYNFFKEALTSNEITIFIDNCLQLDSLMNIYLEDVFPGMKFFFHKDINYKQDLFYIFSDINAMLNYLFNLISIQIHKIFSLYLYDYSILYDFNFSVMKKSINLATLILQVLKKFLDLKQNFLNNKITKEEYDFIYNNIENEFKDLEFDYYSNIYKSNPKDVVKEISKLEL